MEVLVMPAEPTKTCEWCRFYRPNVSRHYVPVPYDPSWEPGLGS
jgi:hypothetical protein